MHWLIAPGIGLGPLRFGMRRTDVAAYESVLGAVTAADAGYDGSLNEHRAVDMPVCNYVEGLLTTISTDWHVKNVLFEQTDVYLQEPEVVMRRLFAANGGGHAGLGFILFFRLGINTKGFYDPETGRFLRLQQLEEEEQDERGLAVFAAGAFDPYRDSFSPIDLPGPALT